MEGALVDVGIVEDFARPEPPLTGRASDYWRSGGDGALRIACCQSCGHLTHPPLPVCPVCRSRDLRPKEVSGQGTVYSWTLNRYQWSPGMVPPYVVAQIELVEQPGLLILSNVVECDPADVSMGMPVQVCFARSGEAYIPLFRPAVYLAAANVERAPHDE
jgi:uncharacterized OB-fold protein